MSLSRSSHVADIRQFLWMCLCLKWRWALVGPYAVAPSRMVGVSASDNLPLYHKVQKFSSGTGSPGWSRKKGHKMVVVWCLCFKINKHETILFQHCSSVLNIQKWLKKGTTSTNDKQRVYWKQITTFLRVVCSSKLCSVSRGRQSHLQTGTARWAANGSGWHRRCAGRRYSNPVHIRASIRTRPDSRMLRRDIGFSIYTPADRNSTKLAPQDHRKSSPCTQLHRDWAVIAWLEITTAVLITIKTFSKQVQVYNSNVWPILLKIVL